VDGVFRKVLIANRGEIAVRIIRACRELGIATVLAHSEADRDSLAARLADETVCIGPAPSDRSYLHIPNIVAAALVSHADAIHPGYGFLSENAYLADASERCGVTFIGPPAAAIEIFRDKLAARRLMRQLGVPVLPGTEEPLYSLEAASAAAAGIGYPVMIKATAGGGGRGMRVARDEAELIRHFPICQAEAQSAFGNNGLYLERLVERARHVEIQVVVDHRGEAIHLGERDCSLQRRHQKLLEEAPCPVLSAEARAEMGRVAASAAAAAGYRNVGTLEFLLAPDGRFYFIEMNTRIQVEHPVTEMITGLDLVKWQIRLAAGEPLGLRQDEVCWQGHAIECRVTAEDGDNSFAPDTGLIQEFVPPGGPGIRLDSHVFPGYVTPHHYDSLLAKLIAWGRDRDEAIARMQRALGEFHIVGVKTTLGFHQRILASEAFRAGQITIDYLDRPAALEPSPLALPVR